MPRTEREDEQAVSNFLDRRWDPIGVYDDPSDAPPPGEYESYARLILADLYAGGTADGVLQRLRNARSAMGLEEVDQSEDVHLAHELLQWWAGR